MYTPGNLLYFTPFYFPDGGKSKDKYFIVLTSDNESFMVASLPTKSDCVPSFIEKQHGCINDDSINFNCYYFQAGKPITENGVSFPLDTFVYGERVAQFNKRIFSEVYTVPEAEYKILGKLTDDEFQAILNCLGNSKTTKRGIRRMLGAKI